MLKTRHFQSLSLCSLIMLQQWLKQLIKKNSSQRCNTVNYTATADTLNVDVHVARIVRAKHTCLLRSFNCLVNCSFSGRSNRRGEFFKASGLSTFYVQKIVSNPQFLLFHRAEKYVEYQGFARNWDSIGNVEIIHQVGKLG